MNVSCHILLRVKLMIMALLCAVESLQLLFNYIITTVITGYHYAHCYAISFLSGHLYSRFPLQPFNQH
jgi:hypothetical protein